MGVQVNSYFKSKYTGQQIENALDTFDNLADQYDAAQTYNAGDYVLESNTLYVCKATTTGTFDPSAWDATTLSDLLDAAVNTYTDPNNDGNIVIS